jgi:ATP-dependent exoDNAse (exonuclease V) beta subunit
VARTPLLEPLVQKLRRLPLAWQPPHAPPALRATALDVVEIEQEQPPFDWVTLTSRQIGTLVHRELERFCRSHAADKSSKASLSLARIIVELEEMGVPADRSRGAAERVIAALEHTLADARGRWLLGLERDISEAESELALSSSMQGQIVEGIIDRTFVDRNGIRWIVDFKTSTHEGGGLDAFLDQEVARYRDQLQRYAALMRAFKPTQKVRAALYFPLMRQWREVALEEA